ncbi:uncharacterized protein [Apostichopus japonicus]|uniref:uncharacterized protein isoform X5 n=1 Tax=Stichopus japonicus TaxID=307972 RepID=UPI003AB763ED
MRLKPAFTAIWLAFLVLCVDSQRNTVSIGYYHVRFEYTTNQNGQFLTKTTSTAVSRNRVTIVGHSLWRSELYASREDTGVKRVIEYQLLDHEQASRRLPPGGTLIFTTALNVNVNDYASFTHLCVKLSKHPNAFPDYVFASGANDFVTICRPIPEAQVQEASEIRLQYYRASYQYEHSSSPTSRATSTYLTQVQVDSRTLPNSQTVGGRNVWRMMLFLSPHQDGSGARLILSRQLLNTNQASMYVGPNQQFSFVANRRFKVDNFGPGTAYPYVCTELNTTASSRYLLNFNGQRSAITCSTIRLAPRTLDDHIVAVASYDARIGYSRPNPRINEALANVFYVIRFAESTPIIQGTSVWQIQMFASQHDDGTGQRHLVSQQILNPDQMAVSAGAGKQITFQAIQRFDVTGLGSDNGLPYMCIAFSKHPLSTVNISFQGDSVITTCDLIPQEMLQIADQTPQAIIRGANVNMRFTDTDPYDTMVDTSVVFNVGFSSYSDSIRSGTPLWVLRLFASQNEDGTGNQRELSAQLLNNDQMSYGVIPGRQLQFSGGESIDFTEMGLGSDFPYICASLEKNPDADMELVLGEDDTVTGCQALPRFQQRPRPVVDVPIADQTPQAIIRGANVNMRFTDTDPYDAMVDTTVVFNVGFSSYSDSIRGGTPLWVLRLFASQNEDGTGNQRELSAQLLNNDQMSYGVTPGGQFQLSGGESIDFTEMGLGSDFPYICASLEKNPDADMELVLGKDDTVTGCQALPRFQQRPRPVVDVPIADQTPQAIIRGANVNMRFTDTDQYDAMVYTSVVFDVGFSSYSDSIRSGTPLWVLRLFASQNEDGTGNQRELSAQLLNNDQMSYGVIPGGQFQLSGGESIDFTEIGPGSDFPYICASLDKNPGADMELVFGQDDTVKGCQALPRFQQRPRPVVDVPIADRTPQAIIRGANVNMRFTDTDQYDAMVYTSVVFDVGFSSYSDSIRSGTPLWVLRLFASQNEDGTGNQRELSAQLLNNDQMSYGVIPGGQFQLSGGESIDFTEIGPGSDFPYICASLDKNPGANMELVFGQDDTVKGCQALPRFQQRPRPVVDVPIADQTPQAIIRGANVNMRFTDTDPYDAMVDTTVVFNVGFSSYSDSIRGGTPLWVLRLFASQYENGTGNQRELSAQLLNNDQMSYGVIPGRQFQFSGGESIDFTEMGLGSDFPYICASLEKNPDADMELVLGEDDTVTGCQALPRFQQRPRPVVDVPIADQTPQAIIRGANVNMRFTDTDPYDAMVDTTVVFNVGFSSYSDSIRGGTPLWVLRLFASQYENGTGNQRELSAQLLNNDQMSYGVIPGRQFQFSGGESIDFTEMGLGSDFPYICASLEKNPDADMELVLGEDDTVTGCQALPRFQQRPRPVVDVPIADQTPQAIIRGANVNMRFTDTDQYDAMVYTSVVFDVGFSSYSDSIRSGTPLWVLRLFASQNEDGTGNQRELSAQLLNNDQMSYGVIPGGQFQLSGGESIDFTEIGPGSDFPYICASLDKNPGADMELVFGQDDTVKGCQALPRFQQRPRPVVDVPIADQTPQAIIRGANVNMRFTDTDPYDAMVDTTVVFNVGFSSYSDSIRGGTPLWVLRLFASQYENGTGNQRELSAQLLNNDQMSYGVIPGRQFQFSGGESIDFTEIGPGSDFPYICASLDKNPGADMELVFGQDDTVKGCQALPRFQQRPRPVVDVPIADQTPQAIIRGANVNMRFTDTDPYDAMVDTTVVFNVGFSSYSDSIRGGTPLWVLRLFASQYENGTGNQRELSAQLLNNDQMSYGVIPGRQFQFSGGESIDFTEMGPGSDFPYICASLEKNPDADMELVLGEDDTVTGCQALPKFRQRPRPVVDVPIADQAPQAIIRGANVNMRFTDTDQYDAMVYTSVVFDVGFSSYSDSIRSGTPLWVLRLFASQNEDGTGNQRELSAQLLNNDQMSYGVIPGGQFQLSGGESIDFTEIGPGSDFPYICASLDKNPGADMELVFGQDDTVKGCQALPRFQQRPRPVVDVPIADQTPQAIIRGANVNMRFTDTDPYDAIVDTTVVFNVGFSSYSDSIRGGTPLWVLRLFASQYENGTGNQRELSAQLLNNDQMSYGVTPGGQFQLSGGESIDFTEMGLGSDFPYICASLEKNPDADMELVLGEDDTVTGCQALPRFQQRPRPDVVIAEQSPQAIVRGANVNIRFTDIDPYDAMVDTSVVYNVIFSNVSDAIEGGTPLWMLRLFASQNEDGTGKHKELLEQLLDNDQMSHGVTPGGQLQLRSYESIVFTDIGPDSEFPYICASLEKNPDAYMEINFADASAVTGCEALPRFSHQARPVDGLPLSQQVHLVQHNTRISTSRADPSSNVMVATVQYLLRFPPSTYIFAGDNPLWLLELFASQNDDGTGSKKLISPQLLDHEQMYEAVQPRDVISFTASESFEADEIGAGTDLPYICSSLNSHPLANFELINGEDNFITTCEELLLPHSLSQEEEQHAEASKTAACRIWGDPHLKSFDGYGHSFQNVGEYVAVQTCKDDERTVPTFQLSFETFRRRPSIPVSYIREYTLKYNGEVYALTHPSKVSVNGVTVTLPFTDHNGVRVHYAAPHQILTTDFGLVIRLDNLHNSDVTLTDIFMGKVCGLCGNYDMVRGNECHYRNGTQMQRRNEECKQVFVNEWTDETPDLPYPEHIKDFRPCGEGSTLYDEATTHCGILNDPTGPLASCHPYVSPDIYYNNCVFDLCQLLPSASFLCGSVEAYLYECVQVAGENVQVGDWRNSTQQCEPQCSENMVFESRGSACPPTCADPEGVREDCPFSFLETCECAEGMVLDGTECVPVESCGCKMDNGVYISVGEEFMSSNCSELCTCGEVSGLVCIYPVTCADNAMCGVKGGQRDCYCQKGYVGNGRYQCMDQEYKTCRIYGDPHFLTFDDVFYSFQGGCVYTAVHTCRPLSRGAPPFRIVIKNERLIPEEKYTYTTVVQLLFQSKAYRMAYTGRVTVDGIVMDSRLPYSDEETGIEISRNETTLYLRSVFGLEVSISNDNALAIKLPSAYFGKVCGLCGNADGNDENDKMLPNGTLGKKLPFANSWAFGQCVPLDEPIENCEDGSDDYAEAVDLCNEIIRKDGPFAYCHDYQSPLPFFHSCVFDLCGNLPDTELFCASANQYVQACADKGAGTGLDWKKDVPACAPVDCPEGYTPFKRSCYKFWRIKKNFEDSKSFCKVKGGHLVTITSREESDFVSELAGTRRVWIGAERNFSASFQTYNSSGDDSYTFLPDRIPRGIGSIRFSITARSDAYIILSPTMEPDEHTPVYEIAIGVNRRNFIRRCMDCPEEDSEQKYLLGANTEQRFYVNFRDGNVRVGRYTIRNINLHFIDQNPFRVYYVGFKTVGEAGTWKFFDNDFMWLTSERWSYDNYRYGEPSNYDGQENCLETNFDSKIGAWNDHFCNLKKSFVCEI